MYSLVAISFVLVLLCVWYMQDNNNIPGPGVLEVVMSLMDIIKQPHVVMTRWAMCYGKIFSFRCGLRSSVVISDPDLIREVYKQDSSAGRFTHHPIFNTLNENGHGVLHSDGEQWEEQRKFILQNIKLRQSTPVETIILAEASMLVDFIFTNEGQPIDGSEVVKSAVGNVLWQVMLNDRAGNIGQKSTRLEAAEDVLNNFLRVTNSPLFLFPWLRHLMPQLTGWREYLQNIQHMNHIMETEIEQHLKTFNENDLRDLTDYFIRQIKKTNNPGSSFYKESGKRNMVASVTELLLGGIETSSTTLSWALLFLSEHRDIQAKLHKEIDSVVGTDPVSLVYRSKMPYIRAIISEVLRLGSVTPLGLPHVMTKEETVQGYKLPKGAYIISNLFAVHHSKTIWKDPKNFRPERFIENKQYVTRKNLIPFSEGKRKCIGEGNAQDLLFLFLVTIFQRFVVNPEYPGKAANFEPKSGTALTPQPFKVVFVNRGM